MYCLSIGSDRLVEDHVDAVQYIPTKTPAVMLSQKAQRPKRARIFPATSTACASAAADSLFVMRVCAVRRQARRLEAVTRACGPLTALSDVERLLECRV
jgi:hypothetical protein